MFVLVVDFQSLSSVGFKECVGGGGGGQVKHVK